MAADGTVYVADAGRPALDCLRARRGKLVADPAVSPPPGGWNTPWGVALDSAGRIYVTDAGRDRIFIFSKDGQLQQTLGPDLASGIRLSQPRAIVVTDPEETWSCYHDAYIYVVDQAGQRIVRMDLNGNVHKTLAAKDLPGSNTLTAFGWMGLDYYENCWITDRENNRILKLNRHFDYLDAFGRPGEGDGCFTHPSGIAIYRHYGQVFVAEDHGVHYFWVGADVRECHAGWEKTPGLFRVDFFLTEPAWVTIHCQDGQGRAFFICQKLFLDSGPQKIFGSLADHSQPSEIAMDLTAEATYSSASYFAKRVRITLPSR